MKIKKFNQLYESDIVDDLQYDLDDFVKNVDLWFYDNEEKIEDTIEIISELSNIIYDYDEWFKKNKEKIGQSEINKTISNITGLNVLHSLKQDDITNLIKLLQKSINKHD